MLGLFVLLFIYIIGTVKGIVPYQCAHNITATEAVCCPIPRHSTAPCGYPRRGACHWISVRKVPKTQNHYFKQDVKYMWPSKLFDYGCQCRRNFFGADCGSCWHGWTGARCDRRIIRTRRNIAKYSKEEKKLFQDVLLKTRRVLSDYVVLDEPYRSRDKLSWRRANVHEVLANIHFLGYRSYITPSKGLCDILEKHDTDMNCNHEGPGFPTWHRYFMLQWEREARRIARRYFGVKDFTFPYWDWTDKTKCEVCTDDLIGAEGEEEPLQGSRRLSRHSPFRHWTTYCFDNKTKVPTTSECYPCHLGVEGVPLVRAWAYNQFPRLRDIKEALSKTVYFVPSSTDCHGFASYLEGSCPFPGKGKKYETLHNRLHMMCNGTFTSSKTSPNDPMFVFHHLQVDRIFQKWFAYRRPHMAQFPNSGVSCHCRDCNMVGFYPPVQHRTLFKDTRLLGYKYDSYDFGSPDSFGDSNEDAAGDE